MIVAPIHSLGELKSPKIIKKGREYEFICKTSGLVKSGGFSKKGGNVRIFLLS